MNNLKSYLECELARLKSRTPEQRQADREQELRPGIFISREGQEAFKRMSPEEQKEAVKSINARLKEGGS